MFRWLLRLVLAGVLGVAGALKLGDPNAFAQEIANYQLLPDLAPYVAVLLPPIELITAVALLLPLRPWRRAAAVTAIVLLLGFTFAVVSALLRGVNIDCGCFGGSSGPVSALTVVRNIALIAVAVLLVLGEREQVG